MIDYTVSIELLSDTLPGSGEGWGSVIDNDIVFDSLGLPFLPAKRIKGMLRSSANEIIEMFQSSNIKLFCNDKMNKSYDDIMSEIFGQAGSNKSIGAVFNDLKIPQYEDTASWCRWALEKYNNILSPEVIINTFTNIRQQTAIAEDGIAKENSLRTSRVLKADIKFEGKVSFHNCSDKAIDFLAIACANLRALGTMRNRGFGEIKCSLFNGQENISEKAIENLADKEVY